MKRPAVTQLTRSTKRRRTVPVTRKPEVKRYIRAFDLDLDNHTAAYALDYIASGSGQQNRIGDQISKLYLRVRLYFESNPTDLVADYWWGRVMVVQAKSGPLTTSDFPVSRNTIPNVAKFNILYDDVHMLNTQAIASTDTGAVSAAVSNSDKLSLNIPLNGRRTFYTGSTADDGARGSIYLYIQGRNVNANYAPRAFGYTDLYFKDP